ncbi:MAG: hypothetical protein ACRDTZ_03375 [Pseudonocardiaceae bacterium]
MAWTPTPKIAGAGTLGPLAAGLLVWALPTMPAELAAAGGALLAAVVGYLIGPWRTRSTRPAALEPDPGP